MKKHITNKQYLELRNQGKLKLRKWINNPIVNKWKLDTPFHLSIGQMIEFLIEKESLDGDEYGWLVFRGVSTYNLKEKPNALADALWEEVKEVLER